MLPRFIRSLKIKVFLPFFILPFFVSLFLCCYTVSYLHERELNNEKKQLAYQQELLTNHSVLGTEVTEEPVTPTVTPTPIAKNKSLPTVNKKSGEKTVLAAESSTSQNDLKAVSVLGSTGTVPSATPAPVLTPTPTPISSQSHPSWSIESVSSMKETKDRICGPRPESFIKEWVEKAKELGVNYISIEQPYDNPSCGDAIAYTKQWVNEIRSSGLHVWHRHMPLAFEGIYNVTKSTSVDVLSMIKTYITSNPSLFAAGDIFTPVPEPQNGGISGITYCAENICQFSSKEQFNMFLRSAMSTAKSAFAQIGLSDQIKVGYYGFDGFVTWGSNNPDWHGILEDETVKEMGNITIDHYPEQIGTQMGSDLDQLEKKYPGVPIIIGEWGTVTAGDQVQQIQNSMGAAKRASVIGFNYWHMGMGGNESLINDDFSEKPGFQAVQSFFK